MRVLATLTLLISASFCVETDPGTPTRPILSASEAALFNKTAYLQGWTPPTISTTTADYTVSGDGYSTIQEAVNAAIKDGGTSRKYINISEGTYNQIVYIPSTNVPLTLYGAGSNASSTVISLNLSANTAGTDYTSLIGTLFSSGDPAYSMYSACAKRTRIGTGCSTIFWVKSTNVQIINLTIQNLSKQPGTDQAVALYTQADQVQVSNCRLLGHQDTLWSGATNSINRGHVENTYIEGDVDFVFGGGSTVFEGCTFYANSDRRNGSAIMFAPATPPNNQYGYLVLNSTITGDSSWLTSKTVSLARGWDAGVASLSDYVVGTSPNGQLVVRDSIIDDILRAGAPYSASTSKRVYSGNVAINRDLNDNNYNRFWEYANTGNGA